ncbi:ArsR/SmtB family transcription factor [Paraliomyxa miuraensis]|uniref:ArsR/SmtB family transcription factor n=1 Tax=Paraliomyxa miuraensis TaxID=376150 RepID=UPI00225156F2|nr:metalloregulator ArsR/SmtB family transcription factor [Paraliomyxa miuraensis]MCX4241073.1 metalloregulator ArsR/SmtB family transcription factor [Paraliomyxa miuraensis]
MSGAITHDLEGTVGLLGLLADPTRLRLLSLLDGAELSVAELTRITELPQSRVSTHLGRLRSASLLAEHRAGNCTRLTLDRKRLPATEAKLWSLVRAQTDDRVLAADRERREALLLDRREHEAGWPDLVAGQMEHRYSPGRTWEATARGLVGLLRLGDVLDVGSGDGVLTTLLAPRARSVTCLDRSPAVIAAAAERLAKLPNVHLCEGDMHDLPFPDATFDQVLHFHALTYATDPHRALHEAHRVLRPGGDLVLVTLHEHRHTEIARSYSQVVDGFSIDELQRLVEEAGLGVSCCDITSRERRKPYFEVVTVFAHRPADTEVPSRPRRPTTPTKKKAKVS